jgi:ADP-heptose:LPS heptosyltransferase
MASHMRSVKDIERFGKELILAIGRWSFRPSVGTAFDPTQCRRILIVRQDNRLGNLILIEPLLRSLRQGFPSAHLALVVGEAFSELYLPGTIVDEVIVFPQSRLARNPALLIPWLRRLRAARWDLAIDSAHPRTISTTNLLLVSASGARWRCGFARDGTRRSLNVTIPPPHPGPYVAEQLLLLKPLGAPPVISSPHFDLPPGWETIARRFRRALDVDEQTPLCGFWIGGRYDKRWDLPEFMRFYQRLDQETPQRFLPVLLSGPSENVAVDPSFRHYHFTGPIWELAACLKTLAWLLSADSGPRHLAVALGVPSIGLFRGGAHVEYGHADGKHHFDFSIDHEPNLHSELLSAVDTIWQERGRRNLLPGSVEESCCACGMPLND